MKIYLATIGIVVLFGGYLAVTNNKNSNVTQNIKTAAIASNVGQNVRTLAIASEEEIEGLRVLSDPFVCLAIVPANLDEMIRESDLIVIGTPQQSIRESKPFIRRHSDGTVIENFSITKFKIQRILKGSPDRMTIPVAQQAAVVADRKIGQTYLTVAEEYRPLVKNAKYILFLHKGLNNSPLYFTMSVYYGKVNTDGADRVEEKNLDVNARSIRQAALERFKQVADRT